MLVDLSATRNVNRNAIYRLVNPDEHGEGMGLFGIQATVEVLIPHGENMSIIHRVTSPGLWGVDKTTGEYADEVYMAEVNTLVMMLEYLGFKVVD